MFGWFGKNKRVRELRTERDWQLLRQRAEVAEYDREKWRNMYLERMRWFEKVLDQSRRDVKELCSLVAKMQESGKSLPVGADDEHWRRYRIDDYEDRPKAVPEVYREYDPPSEYSLTDEEEDTWNNG